MTADVELLPCGECGMPCRPGEYHPYAACLMFKTCRNSDTVRGNLQDAQDHATAEKDAEIDALRTRLEDTVRDSTNKIEALRAELGCLQQQYDERTACTIVHRGAALACSDAVRAAYYEEYERAKRLEAALRQLLGACEDSCDFADPQGRGTLREADAMDRAYKALEQESNDA